MAERPAAAAENAIRALLEKRSPSGSICPSDAARALDPLHWRQQMDAVRSAGSRLALTGEIVVTQRDRTLPPQGPWRGAIRLRLPPSR